MVWSSIPFPSSLASSTIVTFRPLFTRNSASWHPWMSPPRITTFFPSGIQNFVSHLRKSGLKSLRIKFKVLYKSLLPTTFFRLMPGISGTEDTPPAARTTISGLIFSITIESTAFPWCISTPTLVTCRER